MPAPSVGTCAFRSSAAHRAAGATVVSVDATAFLLPHHQNSQYYSFLQAKARKHHANCSIRCMKRVKQLLARGCSPASYLVTKAKELRSRYFDHEVGEVGSGLMGMEPYFSIPVVVPVPSGVI